MAAPGLGLDPHLPVSVILNLLRKLKKKLKQGSLNTPLS